MMFGRNKGVDAILPFLPGNGVGVEIGVWKGDSSVKFMQKCRHLHLVDPWSVEAYRTSKDFGGFAAFLERYIPLVGSMDVEEYQKHYDFIHAEVVARFRDCPVTIHRMTSKDFFKQMDFRADWIYIDGDHSYLGCLEDIIQAYQFTDFVCGDDYGVKPGVTDAVDDAAKMIGGTVDWIGHGQWKLCIHRQ